LALIPPIALRWPIKKIAVAATLVVLCCYLMLSGAAIPTERAFVMNGIVFAAILIDRLRIRFGSARSPPGSSCFSRRKASPGSAFRCRLARSSR
jgi:hypothetical protein